MRKGKTYESGVDTLAIKSTVETILVPVPRPLYMTIEIDDSVRAVYFDLETTSLKKDCEILELAAVHSNSTFCRYIMPHRDIDPKASKVTGLSVRDDVLHYSSTALQTVTIQQCLTDFLDRCKDIGKVLLVGYNRKTFDALCLLYNAREAHLLDDITTQIHGFADSLSLVKAEYKGQVPRVIKNYKLSTVAAHVLNRDFCAHKAMEDDTVL